MAGYTIINNDNSHNDETVVLKFSGKALSDKESLFNILKELVGRRIVVVHGGGVEVDALFAKLDLKVIKKDGLRVSPQEQMPYICGALAGTCNKEIMGLAIKAGLNAVGIMASDGKTLKVSKKSLDLGMVGNVTPYKKDFLNLLLSSGYTPIVSSLAMDEKGELYNVNADDAATAIAAVLKAKLYLISDVSGVKDKSGQIIPSLDEDKVKALIEDGTITDGMVVKVKSAIKIIKEHAINVCIASYREDGLGQKIRQGLFCGTTFVA